MFVDGFLCIRDAMYGHYGRGEKGNQVLEVAIYSAYLYGASCVHWCVHYIQFIVMIQNVLVVIVVALAMVFLLSQVWRSFFSKKSKCQGCAVHQLHQMKMERTKR